MSGWHDGPVLQIEGLSKRYGDLRAADDVTLSVPRGRVVGFVGPNGAGKTTTMRAIFGLVRPDAGTVTWDGAVVSGRQLGRFGYLPEQRGLYPKMKIAEQITYFGELKGMTSSAAATSTRALLYDLGLGDRADDPLEKLSHGNQQRVQLAIAMVHEPDLLVLDEPFNGLDPVAVTTLQGVLVDRARSGVAVLFSSHQLDLVDQVCDDVVMIVDGSVRAAGPVDEVRESVGTRMVTIAGELPGEQLAAHLEQRVPGVHARVTGGRRVRVEVDGGTDLVERLLAEATAAGRIVTFRYEPPTLAEVFEHVAGAEPVAATGGER